MPLNLQLTLDFSVPLLAETGFHKRITSLEMSARANPKDEAGPKGLWADPVTRTIMLMPQQLRDDWLNTTNQLTSVIRLDDMAVAAADLSASRVFEAPLAGNTANPFIYHVPVGPSGAFPSGSGAPPVLTGILFGASQVGVNLGSIFYNKLFNSPATMPPAASPPAPVQAGTDDEGKYICQTKAKLDANAGCYFRWFQPASHLSFASYYSFFIAQLRIDVKSTMVEVWQDNSPNGDRSSYQKLTAKPLFSFDDVSVQPGLRHLWLTHTNPNEIAAHTRGLLVLPFNRKQILLYSSAGKATVVQVRGTGRRLPDGSDWDITRSDTMAVKARTPTPGHFQIQKLSFLTGGVTFQSPHIYMIYTPAVAPTVTVAKDSDHGTSITAVRSQDPTTYTLPKPPADPCPEETGNVTTQRALYGIEVTLTASGDGRWTPFFYAAALSASPTFTASAAVPETVNDISPGSIIRSAKVTGGDKPGDGRMTVEMLDRTPFPLADKYYRSGYPIRLTRGGTTFFTGITRPTEVTPYKLATSRPRRVVVAALDLWQRVNETYVPDDRDWAGTGHISTVLSIIERCGVDVSAAITPPLTAQWNTPLAGVNADERSAAQEAGTLEPGWQMQATESAGGFIRRIAENFSGWLLGFQPDGKPYYFPREVIPGVPYFPTPAVTFHAASSGSTPTFSDATFTTQEPEAVVVAVEGGNDTDGEPLRSSAFVDWAAIRNTSAVNFVGRWKWEVVKVRGTYSCGELNRIARTIWTQTRRRRIIANWTANFIGAVPGVGSVVTIGTYGNYMVQGFDLDLSNDNNLSGRFTGVLVETGYS